MTSFPTVHQVKAPYESDEERVQDMLVFMTAGHDTTAGTLTLALMDLAHNPHTLALVQARTQSNLRALPFLSQTTRRSSCVPL